MIRQNLPSDLMYYFGVNLEEFQAFWKTLTLAEKHYFLTANLH